MATKNCNVCGVDRDLTDFYVNIHRAQGVMGTCKPCTKVIRKERYRAKKEAAATAEPRKVAKWKPPETALSATYTHR